MGVFFIKNIGVTELRSMKRLLLIARIEIEKFMELQNLGPKTNTHGSQC